jgi:hypothetical protein
MSERQNSAFYGEDGRPAILGVIASLRTLIGYDDWPNEIVDACAYILQVCKGPVNLMKMPPWVC